jgi:hypothetical protein
VVDFGDALLAIIVSVHKRSSGGKAEESREHGGYEWGSAMERND